ncbi:hypothetical protein CYMTET_44315 [Cymbomonas tetramitiformis]|uniref:Uncharacterized protein n=1 Tax=Cymbomonas tetramitiformis TaxID=36881 RepID=A0AAE0C1L7_9CHLO|nr:hypothetical protein CYMTET_44315 [Cymbomonas tetramitiformis]|eukprot:gene835-1312_t
MDRHSEGSSQANFHEFGETQEGGARKRGCKEETIVHVPRHEETYAQHMISDMRRLKNSMLTQESPLFLTAAALSLFVILFLFMWYMEWFPSYYFHLHSEDVIFFDTYRLNTRTKALSALSANFFLTAVNVYVRRTVSSWQINYINSPHIPRSDLQSTLHIQMTMFCYTLFVCLSGAINIFLIFSNFWFLMAQSTSTVLVTLLMTQLFLHEKQLAEKVEMTNFDLYETVHRQQKDTKVRAQIMDDASMMAPGGMGDIYRTVPRASNAQTVAIEEAFRTATEPSVRRGVLNI